MLLAGCAPVVMPSMHVTEGPSATPGSSSDGTATPIPSPSTTVAPGLDVELHELAPEHRPCSTDLWNLGTEFVWVKYAPAHESCPDIWRYAPGSPAPELVFRSDDRDAVLGPVVGAHGAYAFLERSHDGVIDTGWKLWYLGRAGAKPALLARGTSGQQAAATLTSDDERVVWASFDTPATGPGATDDPPATSSLHIVRWSNPRTVETIATFTMRDGQVWFPTLNGDELWYGIIRGDSAYQEGDDSRIEMLNLREEDPTPVALPGVGREFNPAVNDDSIVYKRPEPGLAALDWGTISVVNRSSNRTVDVIEDGNQPTIGNRFVAFDTIFGNSVYVYDPEADRLTTLLTMSGNGGVGGVSICGDLLSFVRYPDNGPASIWWGTLPD
jgi:hypothetical protein